MRVERLWISSSSVMVPRPGSAPLLVACPQESFLSFLNIGFFTESVLVSQSCLTLCDPHGLYSPPGSWNPGGKGIARISLPGFPRQEFWSRLPCPSPGDLPDPGVGSTSPALAGGFFTAEPPGVDALSHPVLQMKGLRLA